MTFPALVKPAYGEACNGCGYCCTAQPCRLAEELLGCTTGPCVALEADGNRTVCGLVRNPLGYLFRAARPEAPAEILDAPVPGEAAARLSADLAAALGLGAGCDAADDEDSARWNADACRQGRAVG